MKVLYAIQGTGNGHLTRAMEIIPELQKHVDLDILISGTQSDIKLPFDVKYRLRGMSFIFGKKGGVALWKTYKHANTRRFYTEVRDLPVERYHLVINDFEPVSAWAAYFKKVPCVALSNQAALLSPKLKLPKKVASLGKFIIENYAPSVAQYPFHFQRFDKNIFTPVIRKEIRNLQTENLGHYTVYLPAHDEIEIIKYLSTFSNIEWQLFSKHHKGPAFIDRNIIVHSLNNELFKESLRTCSGIISAAGFGTTSEALFLRKKLLVIPMKAQFEQQCNANFLKNMGVTVVKKLKKKHLPTIENWLKFGEPIEVDYPDNSAKIIEKILSDFSYLEDKEQITSKLKQIA